MTLNDYQSACLRTDNEALAQNDSLLMIALGIAEEAGEVVGILRKELYHKKPTSQEKYREELGDLFWGVSMMAFKLGLSLEDVAAANIEKLQTRYPDGFSEKASNNREP